MKVYPGSQFNSNNTSITSDGAYIYLLIGQEKREMMYKIGSGMRGTIAGRVYLSKSAQREGQMTWAYCRGRLYMRLAGGKVGLLHVIDPSDFHSDGEITLNLEEQFGEQA